MLRTLSISSTICRNDWLLTILEEREDNNSSDMSAAAAAAADAVAVNEVDNDDDAGRSIRSQSKNATLRNKATSQTDNCMALAGCWNV